MAIAAGVTARVAKAGDVAWLNDVQQPPAAPLDNPPRLSPLLVDPAGRPITTLAEWKTERDRVRETWLEFLGPMPVDRPAVKLEVLEEDRPERCPRQLVRYECEPGQMVEGFLLKPSADLPGKGRNGKRAGIVALHQTSEDTIREIAGVRGPEAQHLGLRLAQRGFVVFCPRCFLWQDADDYGRAVDNFQRRHPRTLGMHKMLYDAMRGVDILATLTDDVDPKRIGACGHSLGAKETLYLAAFDDRIAAAVASEGGIGFSFTNWDAPWYLGDGIRAAEFPLNHHQLLALAAPRPFLVLAGESGRGASDGDRTWPYIEAALPVYRLYGSPARLGLYNHREGHTISNATFDRLAEWLETYLEPLHVRP